jgi:hypothetical protein
MPHLHSDEMPIIALSRAPAEEARMTYTALSLSLFGAAYAFLLSLTVF